MSRIINSFNFGLPPYITTANDYDGTNDFAAHAGDLTGMADGKEGTLSVLLRLDGGDGALQRVFSNQGNRFLFERQADDTFRLRAQTSAASTLIQVISDTAYTASSVWLHHLIAWNAATPEAHYFVNDVTDEAAGSIEIDGTIDYTRTAWRFGATVATGGNKLNGCASEIWFDPTFIDISVLANRRLFIRADGKPEDLGATGQTPTGGPVLVYSKTGDLSTNLGTGGNFTITGALTPCSSNPSD